MAFTLDDFKDFDTTIIGIVASFHKNIITQTELNTDTYSINTLAYSCDLDKFAELGAAIIDKKLVPSVFGAYGK